MKYSELNLDPRLQSAIEKLNYVDMTAIQEQTIPHILDGKDVAGLAQTGTGKTAAFLVPLIERILKTQAEPESPRALKNWNVRSFVLILVPTRELADQINENVVKIAAGTGMKSYPLYGGTGYDKQKEALKSGLQFLVSTPGRLIDLFKENYIDLKQVSAVVFDEADRMFDMGFKEDMVFILERIPRERQFLVFSATLNFDVLNTAYQFGAEPVEINISRDQAKAENVKDFIVHLGHDEKPQYLLSLMKKENSKQVMIFTNFKHNVDRLAMFLMNNNIPAMGISSLMNQTQRNNVIEKFKADNDQNILVATDVAARGLDINGVDLVVNYEMPMECESYVHRIGRTGRAGREGKAYSLICDRDIDSLARVEEYTKKKIDAVYLEDSELVKDFAPLGHDNSFKKRFDRPRPGGGRFPDRGGGRGDNRGEARGDRNDRDRKPRPKRDDGGAPRGPRPPQAGASAPKRAEGAPHANGNGKFNKNREPRERRPVDAQQSRPQQQSRPPRAAVSHAKDTARVQQSKNFRSNVKSASKGANANKSISQTVKSFFQKIFS